MTQPRRYSVTEEEQEFIDRTFKYHSPKDDQAERYILLRAAAHTLSYLILTVCPPSRERTHALNKLQEVVMWANKSIAVNE